MDYLNVLQSFLPEHESRLVTDIETFFEVEMGYDDHQYYMDNYLLLEDNVAEDIRFEALNLYKEHVLLLIEAHGVQLNEEDKPLSFLFKLLQSLHGLITYPNLELGEVLTEEMDSDDAIARLVSLYTPELPEDEVLACILFSSKKLLEIYLEDNDLDIAGTQVGDKEILDNFKVWYRTTKPDEHIKDIALGELPLNASKIIPALATSGAIKDPNEWLGVGICCGVSLDNLAQGTLALIAPHVSVDVRITIEPLLIKLANQFLKEVNNDPA